MAPGPSSTRAWIGASTLPSRTLYPHQWSWDSAFIAIGRSWYDEAKAQQEPVAVPGPMGGRPRAAHRLQPVGRRGRVLSGSSVLGVVEAPPQAPRDVETSGITQPSIHARAALEMHRHARDVEASKAFLAWIYPHLAAEHAYLDGPRTISGTACRWSCIPGNRGLDNSPAWDRDLAEMVIPPGAIPPYQRHDLDHSNAADRPTRWPTTRSSSWPRNTASAATTTRGC